VILSCNAMRELCQSVLFSRTGCVRVAGEELVHLGVVEAEMGKEVGKADVSAGHQADTRALHRLGQGDATVRQRL
jgi:hypothetical protein